jgi:hypothetical protein
VLNVVAHDRVAAARMFHVRADLDADLSTGRDEGALVTIRVRFQFLKYCPRPEQTSVDDGGTPTVSLRETMDFSQPCCRLHVVAWPVTVQIVLKNDAKSSFFELRRNMFSQRFQKRRILPGPFGLIHKCRLWTSPIVQRSILCAATRVYRCKVNVNIRITDVKPSKI